MPVRPANTQATDWNDFQAFLAVARTGQLARAGRMMGMASSELESANSPSGPTGSVRISVSEGFGSWIVARHLGGFAARYPGLTVDLVASSGFLSPSRREADIAVLLSRPKTGPLIARKLSNYALRLYASPVYLAGRKPILAPSDLRQGHQLVGYVPELIYAPELNYLGDIDASLAPTLRSTSILAQHSMLASHAGVGVLPCFIGDADPTLVPVLPGHSITRSFWLVTHKDTHGLQRIRVTMDWLSEIVKLDARLFSGV
ncbi:DNA-binding transcriptional LysR family regulator [Novosphingobium sp. SG751A]|uniref:LysR family transcriptional regulator n=1 Tax=Novosphingobium sp. SG751A TaxID=2587000 RepID=UPI00155546E8|nr:LysR family transcriptional regulator [Novosphingobium sp. SG751A]NOW47358.1 DNA-binding transcriptional LysR family regulator [Novosphingobium sp. SG751A]